MRTSKNLLAAVLFFFALRALAVDLPVQIPATGVLPAPQAHAFAVDIRQLRSEYDPKLENQLAVGRTLKVNLSSGTWTRDAASGLWVWQYALDVPGASRLFFVQAKTSLPTGAVLEVGDGKGFANAYGPEAVVNGYLNPALVPGSHLQLRIFTPTQKGVQFAFEHLLIGAGEAAVVSAPPQGNVSYNSTGTKAPSCYDGSGNLQVTNRCRADMAENYMCHIDPANKIISRGSVGLVVTSPSDTTASAYCSGTLVNDMGSTGKHYIMTARHCTRQPQGSLANYNANIITVYWDRANSCGATLQHFFDITGPTTSGYSTASVMEFVSYPGPRKQGDAWLLQSTQAIPAGASPIWQGVDATPPTCTDDCTDSSITKTRLVTYGLGYAKQYMQNDGPVYIKPPNSYAFLQDATWVSKYVDNDTGIGASEPGSSGAGFFDQSGRLRGHVSASSEEVYDYTYFFRLDRAWHGTVPNEDVYYPDGVDIKAILDPANTGSLLTNTFKDSTRTDNLDVLFTANQAVNVADGATLTFSWLTDDVTACTASASPANAGWTGAISPSNSAVATKTVTTATGTQSFTLDCQNAGAFHKSRTITVSPPAPPAPAPATTSGGGGGGGSLALLDLCLMLLVPGLRRAKRV